MSQPADETALGGAPPPAQPRLGTLLVEHGLLTAAQLAQALVEQERTGAQLGQVVVRLGFTTAPAVAQAIATQRGGVAKTEFGMAVGFGTTLPAPPVPLPPVSVGAPVADRPSYADLQAQLRAADDRLGAMAEEMVRAARRIAALEVERNRALAQAAAGRRVAQRL